MFKFQIPKGKFKEKIPKFKIPNSKGGIQRENSKI